MFIGSVKATNLTGEHCFNLIRPISNATMQTSVHDLNATVKISSINTKCLMQMNIPWIRIAKAQINFFRLGLYYCIKWSPNNESTAICSGHVLIYLTQSISDFYVVRCRCKMAWYFNDTLYIWCQTDSLEWYPCIFISVLLVCLHLANKHM